VPQDTFSGSIVKRCANWFGGMLSSYSGTCRSILRCTYEIQNRIAVSIHIIKGDVK